MYKTKSVFGVIIVCGCLLSGCVSYGIPREGNWGRTLQINQNQVTDKLTAIDQESEITLFSFFDTPSAQPIFVNKLDSNHWVVVFEKPNKMAQPDIQIQEISADEVHVIYKRSAKVE